MIIFNTKFIFIVYFAYFTIILSADSRNYLIAEEQQSNIPSKT